jgi:hypothetical protein
MWHLQDRLAFLQYAAKGCTRLARLFIPGTWNMLKARAHVFSLVLQYHRAFLQHAANGCTRLASLSIAWRL